MKLKWFCKLGTGAGYWWSFHIKQTERRNACGLAVLHPALCSQVEGWESHALKPPLWFTRSSCPDMSMCFIVLTIVCTLHCYCGLPLDTCGQWTVHVMHACLWSTLSTVSGYGIGLRWSGIMAIRSTLTKGHSTTQRHLWEHHHLNEVNRCLARYFICVIAKQIKTFVSYWEKNWWAPIYWGPGSIILEPRLQYIGAPSYQKHVFCFIFEHVSR